MNVPSDVPNAPTDPRLKRVYKIDLAKPGLTDVTNVASLPVLAGDLGDNVPVDTTLVIDLLNPDYKVNATESIRDIIAEKMEGLDSASCRGRSLGARPEIRDQPDDTSRQIPGEEGLVPYLPLTRPSKPRSGLRLSSAGRLNG
jgi:hypothetical protein